MHLLWQDFRYGLRTLVKNPGFCAVAVLALGLGIGPNTAIFTMVNAVLLKPLPIPEPNRVVMIWGTLTTWSGNSRRARSTTCRRPSPFPSTA